MKKEGKGDESKQRETSARSLFRTMNCACAVKKNTNVLKMLHQSIFLIHTLTAYVHLFP
jgi:hypothetical protein